MTMAIPYGKLPESSQPAERGARRGEPQPYGVAGLSRKLNFSVGAASCREMIAAGTPLPQRTSLLADQVAPSAMARQ
jgi:hypothetical protein